MTLEEFRALLGQTLDFYNSEHTSTKIDEGVSGGLGAVRYDVPQTLAEAQKATARMNLGIEGGGAGGGNFEAVYDVTTAAEIEAAYQAGMTITMNNNGVIFYLRERSNENLFVFTTAPYYIDIFKEIYIYTATVDGITWSTALTKAEPISNKVTTIDENSTNKQYPSAKAVFDFVNENGGGGGDSGADLLNADGIIKQQYFPAGYPYSEFSEGVIWPETSYSVSEDSLAYIMGTPPKITIGKEYTVTWNGTNYSCVAIDGATLGETGANVLGNVGALSGGEDTGEPFALLIATADSEFGQSGIAAIIAPLDGTTSGTISITGPIETVTIIAKNFLPEGYPYTAKGIGAILATDFAIDSDTGMGYITEPFTVEIGQEYTVTLSNNYTCIAGNGNITGDESIYAYLGNVGALTGGEDTGEPFVILIPKTESEMAQAGISAAIVTFNGISSGSLTITGPTEIITPIAKKYLTNVVEPFVIYGEVYRHDNTNTFYIRTETTFAEALRAAKSHRPVFLYVSLQDILGVDKLRIFPLVDVDEKSITFETAIIDPNELGIYGALQSATLTKMQAIWTAQGTFGYTTTAGTLHGINSPTSAIKLNAQNGKVFEVTVDNTGNLITTEVTT